MVYKLWCNNSYDGFVIHFGGLISKQVNLNPAERIILKKEESDWNAWNDILRSQKNPPPSPALLWSRAWETWLGRNGFGFGDGDGMKTAVLIHLYSPLQGKWVSDLATGWVGISEWICSSCMIGENRQDERYSTTLILVFSWVRKDLEILATRLTTKKKKLMEMIGVLVSFTCSKKS